MSSKRVEAPVVSIIEDDAKPEDEGGKQIKASRRASSRTTTRKRRRADEQVPNAALFVGYVEEAETVEMIMKKFEKLEEIQKKNEGSKLDDSALVEVFQ